MAYQKVIHNARNVQTVYFDSSGGFEQWFLLVSDQHHDSINCNRKLEKEHLDLALERSAYIISAGDTYDLMQGKYDPRKTYDGIRPEYIHKMNSLGNNAYIDMVVEDAIDFYKPYAHLFLVFGRGNHDTGIETRLGTSPVSNLVHGLNTHIFKEGGSHIVQAGGYGGWLRFNFSKGKGNRTSFSYRYFHGNGGDAPVTRGAIQTARQAVDFDADVIHNGHNHQSYHISTRRQRLSESSRITNNIIDFIRTPGYNDGYGDGFAGFEAERLTPKPIGCAWMRIYSRGKQVMREFTSVVE